MAEAAEVRTRDEPLATLNPAAVDADTTRLALVPAEFLAAASGRPVTAAAVTAIQRRLDRAVADLLASHCARLQVRPALPVPHVVVAWGAMGGGLAPQRAADPGIDVAAIVAGVLAALLPAADPGWCARGCPPPPAHGGRPARTSSERRSAGPAPPLHRWPPVR